VPEADIPAGRAHAWALGLVQSYGKERRGFKHTSAVVYRGREKAMERRLAVIFAADVVGYSRLMEQDEAGTFERLKARRRELIEPEIEKHHGRIFKLMGDGLLAEFASVVDAVECAISLQRGMTERNASARDNQRIDLRIGINLGEVIVEGEDRYGDGVNIAARLQQLAEPGGIYVSGKVAKEVEKRIAVTFEAMGEQKVKNIAQPVETYGLSMNTADGSSVRATRRLSQKRRWSMLVIGLALLVVVAVTANWLRPWEPKIELASVERMALPLPDKPSVAVLPFTNMSTEEGQENFTDGMTDDLITDLSKISGLFVIARNSTFVYKGKAVKISQVAEDLGVRYVLEGSVRRAGDKVRINAQLIDALTGGHVWADRFDGNVKTFLLFKTSSCARLWKLCK
jgi:adenylate cyclase